MLENAAVPVEGVGGWTNTTFKECNPGQENVTSDFQIKYYFFICLFEKMKAKYLLSLKLRICRENVLLLCWVSFRWMYIFPI